MFVVCFLLVRISVIVDQIEKGLVIELFKVLISELIEVHYLVNVPKRIDSNTLNIFLRNPSGILLIEGPNWDNIGANEIVVLINSGENENSILGPIKSRNYNCFSICSRIAANKDNTRIGIHVHYLTTVIAIDFLNELVELFGNLLRISEFLRHNVCF